MSFSVVLPNYNHGKLLPRAVLSLMEQNPPPDEIVIIDDASTDDSLAIIARLMDRFSCIRLIRHERNQGTVVGMNDGLQAATRDFVYFFAADDYCLPGFITAATQALARHPEAAFFCGRIVLVDPAGKILGFRPFMWPALHSTMLTPAAVRAKIAASDNWSAGTSVVYRRRRLIEAGGFDNSMGAFCDGLMVRKLAFESGFYFASVVVAAMERYPQSLSAQAALSIEKNTRLIATAIAAVKASFPSDVSVVYSDLLQRRLRFNMAALWLSHKSRIDTQGMAQVLQLSRFAGGVLNAIGRLPLSRSTILIWMALILRPYSIAAMLLGGYRALKGRFEETAIAAQIAEARGRTL
jgi:glycosyltransferase involved in cell wall biosynthesis